MPATVVSRDNVGGSGSEDPARLATTAWTATATAEMGGMHVLTYLTAYLDACCRKRRQVACLPGAETVSCDGAPRPPTCKRGHSRPSSD